MTHPDFQGNPAPTVTQLIEALHVMRDALTNTALMLRDIQFEHDQTQRLAAAEASKLLLDRARHVLPD